MMKNLYVGTSPLTGEIYAGTIDKVKEAWTSKQDVTKLAINAVCEHISMNGGIAHVDYDKNKRFKITVERVN
jgi:hypothetical protein